MRLSKPDSLDVAVSLVGGVYIYGSGLAITVISSVLLSLAIIIHLNCWTMLFYMVMMVFGIYAIRFGKRLLTYGAREYFK